MNFDFYRFWNEQNVVGRLFVYFLAAVSLLAVALALRLARRLRAADSEVRRAQESLQSESVLEARLSLLQSVDARLAYSWQIAGLDITSATNLARLTLIVSSVVAVQNFWPTFEAVSFGDRSGPGPLTWFLYASLRQTCERLGFGLIVWAALCSIPPGFDRILRGRLAAWSYFRQTTELAGGRGGGRHSRSAPRAGDYFSSRIRIWRSFRVPG